MLRMQRAICAAGLLALAACTSGPELTGDGVFALASADPKHPRLRYADGQVSLNDSCMIKLGNKLNPKVPPFYLNGSPVGFC